MGNNNDKMQSVIENLFLSIVNKLIQKNEDVCYNDLFVQIEAESGEIEVYDDNENLLDKTIIFDWVNNSNEDEAFAKESIDILRKVLSDMQSKGNFDHPCFLKPFSINLTDEEFNVTQELLFIDDENLRLDDPLLKDLDADLDEFLSKLLSDVE